MTSPTQESRDYCLASFHHTDGTLNKAEPDGIGARCDSAAQTTILASFLLLPPQKAWGTDCSSTAAEICSTKQVNDTVKLLQETLDTSTKV